MALHRQDNETDFEYKVRLCNEKLAKELDLDWCEIVEVLGLNCSSDHLRKLAYAYKEYTEYLDKNKMKEISDNEILKEIEEKKLELEKEKIRFQDQKREYRKYLRQDARFEHIVETLKEEMSRLNSEHPLVYNPHIHTLNLGIEAALTCSDWHVGSKFKHFFAEYNKDIAKKRINQLLQETITHCKNHNVSTLHLEILGDNQNGLIHIGSRVESDEDVVSQCMTLCELLSEFISELANNIPHIKVYTVMGNHARVNANIKDNIDAENFERLIPWYLSARLQAPNVEIVNANIDDGIILYDICDTKIIGVHGNLDKPQKVVDNMIKMLKIFPDEIHMGHYHHHFEVEEYDIEVSVNGSLMGTDTYAKNIRKNGRPMQKLKIYNKNGQLCTYKIKLD